MRYDKAHLGTGASEAVLSLSPKKKIAVQAECDAAVVGGLRSIISKAAETLS